MNALQERLAGLLAPLLAAYEPLRASGAADDAVGQQALFEHACAFATALAFDAHVLSQRCEVGAVRVDVGAYCVWTYASDDAQLALHELVVLREGGLQLAVLLDLASQPPRVLHVRTG
jgi:hypothetical protein